MKIIFYKYQCTGNDFIIIDNRNLKFPYNKILIKKLCNRRTDIGADGLILIEDHKDYDFEMKYFNSDGTGNMMCGNGGRCAVAFAKHQGIINKNETKFIVANKKYFAGIIKTLKNSSEIALKFNDINNVKIYDDHYVLDTGAPHYVKFVSDLENYDVYHKGKDIRFNDEFKEKGINVDFVERNKNRLFVRTYERGVENETLSCGTGVVASAIAAHLYSKYSKFLSYNIKTLGGILKVKFNKISDKFVDIYLEGPSTFVYKGEIDI
ncbi:MAG: diaminopimelate epimerase [Bacteroidales bacterium]|nr:diaminopimelate epimerase [Bacteroidales bacterium]